jgi:hypothetical protein
MSQVQVAAHAAPATEIPEHRTLFPGSSIVPMRRDPLRFLQGLSAKYGDIVQVRIAYRRLVLINGLRMSAHRRTAS